MKDMHIFEREVSGRRYRIAAQSVWDPARGRSVARQAVLGPATPPPVADLGATRAVGTRAIGDVGALAWVAEQVPKPDMGIEQHLHFAWCDFASVSSIASHSMPSMGSSKSPTGARSVDFKAP